MYEEELERLGSASRSYREFEMIEWNQISI